MCIRDRRKEAAARKAYEEKRAEIIAECEKKVSKLEEEKTVKLYILDSGLSVDNVISVSYTHLEKVMLSPLVARFVAGIPNFTR